MKKLIILLSILFIGISCQEDSIEYAEISAENKLPENVLKSSEFQEFMEILKESMIAKAKIHDEHFKITSGDTEKKRILEKIIEESKKKNFQSLS